MAEDNQNIHFQNLTWRKVVFGVLSIVLILVAFLFGKVKAEGADSSGPYDANLVGNWQIYTIAARSDVPEKYLDISNMTQVTVKDDHTGVMQDETQQATFHWKYSENYEDGSIGYLIRLDDGRQVGAILVGKSSEEYPDFQGMLSINVAKNTMMVFVRVQSNTQKPQTA